MKETEDDEFADLDENEEVSGEDTTEHKVDPFTFLVKTALSLEKTRVAAQVRIKHLEKKQHSDPETEEVYKKLQSLEEYVDDRIATLSRNHPAAPWFTRVKGIGGENIAKVLGPIEIEKAATVSALWKFCGFAVENGKAPRAIKGGGKLSFNKRQRSMCWRLAGSLMKGKGKFYDYYLSQKGALQVRYQREGIKIVPTLELPKKNGKYYEPDGVISEKHVHAQALRKMIKLFLSCLWQAWREAENLPTRNPYVLDHFPEHTHLISCWDMMDRPAKMSRRQREVA